MRKITPGIIFSVAILATLAAYTRTLDFGFRYDDYHVLRPASSAELVQVLHGSWDLTQIESAFYRPITAWWYALRFELFGLNAVAQHMVSLVGMIACAALVGLFVWRETESRRAAVLAAGIYGVHPSLAYSQAVWLTNQMHLLASLVVLLALLAWQRARTRSARAWWPLAVLQLVGFGVKEDLVMLAPLLLALTAVRRLMRRDVPWPTWPVTAVGLAFPIGLFALRYEMLGRLGGYGPLPTADRAWTNFSTGLVQVFRQLPAKRPWEPFVSAFCQTLIATGTVLGLLRRREAHLLVTGVVLAVAFDAPFVFISKAEQYHLIALGAVLALTGAVEVADLARARDSAQDRARVGAGARVRAARAAHAATSRTTSRRARPSRSAPMTSSWTGGSSRRRFRRGCATKAAACRAGRLVPLPDALARATWAYGVEIDEQGGRSVDVRTRADDGGPRDQGRDAGHQADERVGSGADDSPRPVRRIGRQADADFAGVANRNGAGQRDGWQLVEANAPRGSRCLTGVHSR